MGNRLHLCCSGSLPRVAKMLWESEPHFYFLFFLEGMTPLAFSDQGTKLQCSEDSTKMVIMFRESQVQQKSMEADITNKGRRPFYFA